MLARPRPGEVVLALEDTALTLLGDDVHAALLALPGAADVFVRGLSDAVHGGQDTMALFGSVSHPARS